MFVFKQEEDLILHGQAMKIDFKMLEPIADIPARVKSELFGKADPPGEAVGEAAKAITSQPENPGPLVNVVALASGRSLDIAHDAAKSELCARGIP